jgi:hypothetical protein
VGEELPEAGDALYGRHRRSGAVRLQVTLTACAALLWGAAHAHAEIGGLEFEDGPSCRVNEIPLGSPARIDARRDGARVSVNVAANYGCQTTAGRARVEDREGELRLYADTILPGFPTPACKCTRHLSYRFDLQGGGRRIVFVKDGRVEGEGRLEPQ